MAGLVARASCAVGDEPTPRSHPEPPHAYRTDFQRDRARVMHCSAFRRLDFKTQVFVPHEHDHFRTRLTHSLEVAQVTRDLARALGLNEDLAETVALAHDLGHPPFGHGGEAELDALLAGHGGFEHNRQSLRIVDYLEHPYPDFRGLNLTRITRECIARHETRYDIPGGTEEFHEFPSPPLEGQIVNLADEIAYTSADLEDALAAGWLHEDDLGNLALWQRAKQRVYARYSDPRPIHVRIRTVKTIIGVLADDLLTTTRENLQRYAVKTLGDVRNAEPNLVAHSSEIAAELHAVAETLRQRVYHHPAMQQAEQESRGMLRALFETFVTDPAKLPGRYRRRVEEQGVHRVVCDYLAGMTDRFCRAEHARWHP